MAARQTYDFYANEYGGTAVAEADWAHLSQLASAHLARLKRLATVTPYGDANECEAFALCAMAEALQAWEDVAAGGVASESIGSVSVSYGGAADVMPKGLTPALIDAVRPWLHVCLVVA